MTEVAHEAAEGASAGFPPFDTSLFSHQVFWFIISFGILYLTLWLVIIPRISKVIASRKSSIEEDLKTAAEETKKAETAKESAIAAQTNARNQARSKLDTLRKKLDDENAVAQAQANSETEEKIKNAEIAINSSKSNAFAEVSEIIGELAGDIYSNLTGKKPSAALIKSASKGVL